MTDSDPKRSYGRGSFDHLIGASDCKKVPLTRYALESVKTTILEIDAGADNQIFNSA